MVAETTDRTLTERLLSELAEVLRGATDPDWYDPGYDVEFREDLNGSVASDQDVNHLGAIAYALSAGLPVIGWRPAQRNPGGDERVARAVRQFVEAATLLISQFQSGLLASDAFAAALASAYLRQVTNAFTAGKRALGNLSPLSAQDQADLRRTLVAAGLQQGQAIPAGSVGDLLGRIIMASHDPERARLQPTYQKALLDSVAARMRAIMARGFARATAEAEKVPIPQIEERLAAQERPVSKRPQLPPKQQERVDRLKRAIPTIQRSAQAKLVAELERVARMQRSGRLSAGEAAARVNALMQAEQLRALKAAARIAGATGELGAEMAAVAEEGGIAADNQLMGPLAKGGLMAWLAANVFTPWNLVDPDVARWLRDRLEGGTANDFHAASQAGERAAFRVGKAIAPAVPEVPAAVTVADVAAVQAADYVDTSTPVGQTVHVWWVMGFADHCRDCIALSDMSPFSLDKLTMTGIYPGSGHTACLVPGTEVAGAFTGGYRMRYHGEVVEIETRGGRRLTVTPNHPVLTTAGFTPAGMLRPDDELLCASGQIEERGRVRGDVAVDEHHRPAPIEQVLSALAALPSTIAYQAARSAEDFHGDALLGQGDVDVVRPLSELLNDRHSPGCNESRQLVLVGTPEAEGGLGAEGAARRLGITDSTPATGGMSGRGESGALVRTGLLHTHVHALGSVAHVDARLQEPAGQSQAGDAKLLAQLEDAGAGLVSRDRIVKIERLHWDGHVYDLSTVGGWYTADGVVVSNCGGRCRCHLEYDVPDVVCGDALTEMAGLDALEESGNQNEVWVREASACGVPIPVQSLATAIDPPAAGDAPVHDANAFNWSADLASRIAIGKPALKLPKGLEWLDHPPKGAAPFIRQPGVDGVSVPLVQHFLYGGADHVAVVQEDGKAVRFIAGLTVDGPSTYDPEFTVAALRWAAQNAADSGLALEFDDRLINEGMAQFLDSLGATRALIPPVERLPDLAAEPIALFTEAPVRSPGAIALPSIELPTMPAWRRLGPVPHASNSKGVVPVTFEAAVDRERERFVAMNPGLDVRVTTDTFSDEQWGSLRAKAELFDYLGIDRSLNTALSGLSEEGLAGKAFDSGRIGLDANMGLGGKVTVANSFGDAWAHEYAHLVQQRMEQRLGTERTAAFLADFRGDNLLRLSKYADTEDREFWAEAFAAMTRPDYVAGTLKGDTEAWAMMREAGVWSPRAREAPAVVTFGTMPGPDVQVLADPDTAGLLPGWHWADPNKYGKGTTPRILLRDPQGDEWLLKSEGTVQEVSGSRVTRLFGLDAPPVAHHKFGDDWFSWQGIVPNVQSYYVRAPSLSSLDAVLGREEERLLFAHSLVDYLIDNADGHGGNYLYGQGRVWAIDKAYGFTDLATKTGGTPSYSDFYGFWATESLWGTIASDTDNLMLRLMPSDVASILDRFDAVSDQQLLDAVGDAVTKAAARNDLLRRKARVRADVEAFFDTKVTLAPHPPAEWDDWLKAGHRFERAPLKPDPMLGFAAQDVPHVDFSGLLKPKDSGFFKKYSPQQVRDHVLLNVPEDGREAITSQVRNIATLWRKDVATVPTDWQVWLVKGGTFEAPTEVLPPPASLWTPKPYTIPPPSWEWKGVGISKPYVPPPPPPETPFAGITWKIDAKQPVLEDDVVVDVIPIEGVADLNTTPKPWSGTVPDEPPLPDGAIANWQRDELRKAADDAWLHWQDVQEGHVGYAITWNQAETDAAKKAGLAAEKMPDGRYYVAGSQKLLDALRKGIDGGLDTNSDAFWTQWLGFTEAKLKAIDTWEAAKQSSHPLRAGVLIVEPDGRVWVLSPRNRFGGYENTFAKGGVDPGETTAMTAVREVREEMGFSVELDSYLADLTSSDGHSITRYYVGHRTGGGPAFAKTVKETYSVRLGTPAEVRSVLMKHGKLDSRDTKVIDLYLEQAGLPPVAPPITDPPEKLLGLAPDDMSGGAPHLHEQLGYDPSTATASATFWDPEPGVGDAMVATVEGGPDGSVRVHYRDAALVGGPKVRRWQSAAFLGPDGELLAANSPEMKQLRANALLTMLAQLPPDHDLQIAANIGFTPEEWKLIGLDGFTVGGSEAKVISHTDAMFAVVRLTDPTALPATAHVTTLDAQTAAKVAEKLGPDDPSIAGPAVGSNTPGHFAVNPVSAPEGSFYGTYGVDKHFFEDAQFVGEHKSGSLMVATYLMPNGETQVVNAFIGENVIRIGAPKLPKGQPYAKALLLSDIYRLGLHGKPMEVSWLNVENAGLADLLTLIGAKPPAVANGWFIEPSAFAKLKAAIDGNVPITMEAPTIPARPLNMAAQAVTPDPTLAHVAAAPAPTPSGTGTGTGLGSQYGFDQNMAHGAVTGYQKPPVKDGVSQYQPHWTEWDTPKGGTVGVHWDISKTGNLRINDLSYSVGGDYPQYTAAAIVGQLNAFAKYMKQPMLGHAQHLAIRFDDAVLAKLPPDFRDLLKEAGLKSSPYGGWTLGQKATLDLNQRLVNDLVTAPGVAVPVVPVHALSIGDHVAYAGKDSSLKGITGVVSELQSPIGGKPVVLISKDSGGVLQAWEHDLTAAPVAPAPAAEHVTGNGAKIGDKVKSDIGGTTAFTGTVMDVTPTGGGTVMIDALVDVPGAIKSYDLTPAQMAHWHPFAPKGAPKDALGKELAVGDVVNHGGKGSGTITAISGSDVTAAYATGVETVPSTTLVKQAILPTPAVAQHAIGDKVIYQGSDAVHQGMVATILSGSNGQYGIEFENGEKLFSWGKNLQPVKIAAAAPPEQLVKVFVVGDRVQHVEYGGWGPGTVTQVMSTGDVVVKWDTSGTMQLKAGVGTGKLKLVSPPAAAEGAPTGLAAKLGITHEQVMAGYGSSESLGGLTLTIQPVNAFGVVKLAKSGADYVLVSSGTGSNMLGAVQGVLAYATDPLGLGSNTTLHVGPDLLKAAPGFADLLKQAGGTESVHGYIALAHDQGIALAASLKADTLVYGGPGVQQVTTKVAGALDLSGWAPAALNDLKVNLAQIPHATQPKKDTLILRWTSGPVEVGTTIDVPASFAADNAIKVRDIDSSVKGDEVLAFMTAMHYAGETSAGQAVHVEQGVFDLLNSPGFSPDKYKNLLINSYGGHEVISTGGIGRVELAADDAKRLAKDIAAASGAATPGPLPVPPQTGVLAGATLAVPQMATGTAALGYDPLTASLYSVAHEETIAKHPLLAHFTGGKDKMKKSTWTAGNVMGGTTEWRRIGNRLELWSVEGDDVGLFSAQMRTFQKLIADNPKIDSVYLKIDNASVTQWLDTHGYVFNPGNVKLTPKDVNGIVDAFGNDVAGATAAVPANLILGSVPGYEPHDLGAMYLLGPTSEETVAAPYLAGFAGGKDKVKQAFYSDTGAKLDWRRHGNRVEMLQIEGALSTEGVDQYTLLHLRRMADYVAANPKVDRVQIDITWRVKMSPQLQDVLTSQYNAKLLKDGSLNLTPGDVTAIGKALQDDAAAPVLATIAPMVTPPPKLSLLDVSGYDPTLAAALEPVETETVKPSYLAHFSGGKNVAKLETYDNDPIAPAAFTWRRIGQRIEWLDATGNYDANHLYAQVRRFAEAMDASPSIEYIVIRPDVMKGMPDDVRALFTGPFGTSTADGGAKIAKADIEAFQLALKGDVKNWMNPTPIVSTQALLTGVPAKVAPTPKHVFAPGDHVMWGSGSKGVVTGVSADGGTLSVVSSAGTKLAKPSGGVTLYTPTPGPSLTGVQQTHKVGDQVIHLTSGKQGTVTKLYQSGKVEVVFPSGDTVSSQGTHFSPVGAPAIEVGDTVAMPHGATGTVLSVAGPNVKLKSASGAEVSWHINDLMLVSKGAGAPPTAKFRVGDKVKWANDPETYEVMAVHPTGAYGLDTIDVKGGPNGNVYDGMNGATAAVVTPAPAPAAGGWNVGDMVVTPSDGIGKITAKGSQAVMVDVGGPQKVLVDLNDLKPLPEGPFKVGDMVSNGSVEGEVTKVNPAGGVTVTYPKYGDASYGPGGTENIATLTHVAPPAAPFKAGDQVYHSGYSANVTITDVDAVASGEPAGSVQFAAPGGTNTFWLPPEDVSTYLTPALTLKVGDYATLPSGTLVKVADISPGAAPAGAKFEVGDLLTFPAEQNTVYKIGAINADGSVQLLGVTNPTFKLDQFAPKEGTYTVAKPSVTTWKLGDKVTYEGPMSSKLHKPATITGQAPSGNWYVTFENGEKATAPDNWLKPVTAAPPTSTYKVGDTVLSSSNIKGVVTDIKADGNLGVDWENGFGAGTVGIPPSQVTLAPAVTPSAAWSVGDHVEGIGGTKGEVTSVGVDGVHIKWENGYADTYSLEVLSHGNVTKVAGATAPVAAAPQPFAGYVAPAVAPPPPLHEGGWAISPDGTYGKVKQVYKNGKVKLSPTYGYGKNLGTFQQADVIPVADLTAYSGTTIPQVGDVVVDKYSGKADSVIEVHPPTYTGGSYSMTLATQGKQGPYSYYLAKPGSPTSAAVNAPFKVGDKVYVVSEKKPGVITEISSTSGLPIVQTGDVPGSGMLMPDWSDVKAIPAPVAVPVPVTPAAPYRPTATLVTPTSPEYVPPPADQTLSMQAQGPRIPEALKLDKQMGYDAEDMYAMYHLGASEGSLGSVNIVPGASLPQNVTADTWQVSGSASIVGKHADSPSGTYVAFLGVDNHGATAAEERDGVWASLLKYANANATKVTENGAPVSGYLYVSDQVLDQYPQMRDLLLRAGGEDIRVKPPSGQKGGFFNAYGPGIRLDRDHSKIVADALIANTEDVSLQGQVLAAIPAPPQLAAVPTGVKANQPFGLLGADVNTLYLGGTETISANGLRAVSTWANGKIDAEWLRSGSIMEWTDLRIAKGATVAEVNAATARALYSMLTNVSLTPGTVLEVNKAVWQSNPLVRDLFLRYGGAEAATTTRNWIRLASDRVNGMLGDMDAEMGALSAAGTVSKPIVPPTLWPNPADLKLIPKDLGGQTAKRTFVDSTGQEWMFKLGKSGRGAHTDVAVHQLALKLGLRTPPVKEYDLMVDGKLAHGSLQKLVPGSVHIPDPSAITADQQADLMQHSVLDWLVANDDSHWQNFLVDPDGKLWAYDKTRAWVGMGERNDSLNPDLDGQGGVGLAPLINMWWRDVRKNPAILKNVSPRAMGRTLAHLEALSDEEFLKIVQPVLNDYAQYGSRWRSMDDMRKALLLRKNAVRADMEQHWRNELVNAINGPMGPEVPQVWRDWLVKDQGVFKLQLTYEEELLDKLEVMRRDYAPVGGIHSKDQLLERYQQLIDPHGPHAPGRPVGTDDKGKTGAQRVADVHKLLKSYSGGGAGGTAKGFGGERAVNDAAADAREYQTAVTAWATLEATFNKEIADTGWVASLRKSFDPDTGTWFWVRNVIDAPDPAAYLRKREREGYRTGLGGSLGFYGGFHGGGTMISARLRLENMYYSSFLSPERFQSNEGEREIFIRNLQPDQVFRYNKFDSGMWEREARRLSMDPWEYAKKYAGPLVRNAT